MRHCHFAKENFKFTTSKNKEIQDHYDLLDAMRDMDTETRQKIIEDIRKNPEYYAERLKEVTAMLDAIFGIS